MRKLPLCLLTLTALCGVLALPVTAATDDSSFTPRAQPRLGGFGAGAGIGRRGPAQQRAAAVRDRLDDMDANNDDKISLDEFLAARLDRLDDMISHLDQNGDGLLSPDELTAKSQLPTGRARSAAPKRGELPQRPQRPLAGRAAVAGVNSDAIAACMAKANPDFDPPGRPEPAAIADRFATADTNGDGKLSLAELTAVVTAQATTRFARLDRDGDGFLTKADREAAQAERQAMASAVRDCMKAQQ